MFEVASNKKVKLITNAEVHRIEGNIGNFHVKIVKKPRYVIEDKCNGCGACEEACPIFRPNEFDDGLSARKAIYIPFAQAVPKKALIDMKSCVKCRLCVLACEQEAIDFNQKEEEIDIDVGTIIIATGYEVYTPAKGEYGYGKYPDVITQLTLERLLAPNGPTGGELVKISDGKKPKKVVMIQCVGSRDVKTNTYCSEVCCMVALKNAKLIKQEHPETEVTIWYMDLRCPGKEYEDYYRRARQFGINFIRGRPTEVYHNGKNLVVEGENTLSSELMRTEADLVVLSTAVVPSKTTNVLANMLQLDLGPDGFFKEYHSRLNPVETKVPGIYIAGVAQGPKSIAEAVYQAKGAASSAASPMIAGIYVMEIISAQVDKKLCSGCGQCVSICPYGAIVKKEDGKAEVQDINCRGCGLCFSVCPTHAVTVRYYRPQQFEAYIDALLEVEEGKEAAFPRILAFLCWK